MRQHSATGQQKARRTGIRRLVGKHIQPNAVARVGLVATNVDVPIAVHSTCTVRLTAAQRVKAAFVRRGAAPVGVSKGLGVGCTVEQAQRRSAPRARRDLWLGDILLHGQQWHCQNLHVHDQFQNNTIEKRQQSVQT